MVVAIVPGETWEYVCQSDRKLPEEQQTVFVLMVLDGEDQQKLENAGMRADRKSDELKLRMGDQIDLALQLGLHDVRGLRARVQIDTADVLKGFKRVDPDDPKSAFELETMEFKFSTVSTSRGKRRRPEADSLRCLPHSARLEVAEQIIEGNKITDDEGKA